MLIRTNRTLSKSYIRYLYTLASNISVPTPIPITNLSRLLLSSQSQFDKSTSLTSTISINLIRSMSNNSTKTVSGSWTTSISDSGEFKRKDSQFRNTINSDPNNPYQPEPNRYHLYVSLACPWAHRTLIFRNLKGLQSVIGYTVVDWLLGSEGWKFTNKVESCTIDPYNHFERLRQVYELSNPNYSGNITVPVLFDSRTNTIVNNESSEIIRILNSEFNEFIDPKYQSTAAIDYYPIELRTEIDKWNNYIYPNINNGVYRCGFAHSQSAFNTAYNELFTALDTVELQLSKQRYIASPTQLTEADIRLFTTLVRFDSVYNTHFKCNQSRLIDYPNLINYTREIYQMPLIQSTVNFNHIKSHYYVSHKSINPYSIVPPGPNPQLHQPHDRNIKFPINNTTNAAVENDNKSITSNIGNNSGKIPTTTTVSINSDRKEMKTSSL